MNKYRVEGEKCFIEIDSKHGKMTAVIDAEDMPRARALQWFICKTGESLFYVKGKIGFGNKGKFLVGLHQLIMSFPEGMVIDHMNHDTLNNTKENLRAATAEQNSFNARRVKGPSKSGARGVFKNQSGNFRAMIHRKGKTLYLGTYKTQEEAAAAYNAGAREIHGEFALLNILKG